jgi:hypothetical protein
METDGARLPNSIYMKQVQKAQFLVSLDVESKDSLAEMADRFNVRPSLGSFDRGRKIAFPLKPRGVHYSYSRLSVHTSPKSHSSLMARIMSLCKKIASTKILLKAPGSERYRFFIRIGVFYVEEPPSIILPIDLMKLASSLGAPIRLEQYRCSTLAEPNENEKRIRRRIAADFRKKAQGTKARSAKPPSS